MELIKLLLIIVIPACSLHAQESKNEIKECEKVKLIFETKAVFGTPESVIYDQKNDVLYVSNYNVAGGFNRRGDTTKDEFISKINLKGEILELKWIENLYNPTGMAIYNNHLFIVERGKLVEADIASCKIIKKYEIPNSSFANDVIFSENGVGFITDNGQGNSVSIYKFENGLISPWLDSSSVKKPNGIQYRNGEIFVGDQRDYSLKGINIGTKEIRIIGSIEEDKMPGPFDGIVTLTDGSFITTSWSGAGFYYKDGNVCKFMDTKELQNENRKMVNNADSYLIEEKGLLVIPTFMDSSVLIYSFK